MIKFFAIRHTFKAYERLKREQHIDTLFLKGKAFSVFPIRVIYHITEQAVQIEGNELPPLAVPHDIPDYKLKVGFSVPKKKFRSSVDRHRVRRLMAETWRLNKNTLSDAIPHGQQLHVFLVFTSADLPKYEQVHTQVVAAINKLKTIISP